MNNADAMKRRGFSFPPQVADIELLSKVVFLYKGAVGEALFEQLVICFTAYATTH